jgi:hypothetical protein
MDPIRDEAVFGGDIGEEGLQLAEREVDRLSARFAHEVVMARFAAQVKDAGPVPEMNVMEESEAFQNIDGAIDRGLVDRRSRHR